MKHLRYARYLVRHKWFVFRAGLRTHAPLWRLLVHDYTKLMPVEWRAYATYFYGTKSAAAKAAFDRAWLHHQHRNPHHWQHWVLRADSGDLKVLPMPEKFVREMVADWAGAGRAITGKWEVAAWYAANEDRIVLDPRARLQVRSLIGELWPSLEVAPGE